MAIMVLEGGRPRLALDWLLLFSLNVIRARYRRHPYLAAAATPTPRFSRPLREQSTRNSAIDSRVASGTSFVPFVRHIVKWNGSLNDESEVDSTMDSEEDNEEDSDDESEEGSAEGSEEENAQESVEETEEYMGGQI
ncbi:hypothetical protein PPTG_10853 [Phytophthora nicotianae INRA-310]|uniref:Uncharacterized protein n=1 Tax=Phytophthora nicotianae (strain INRA-310) TaxID=761204 RepID=W2QAE8_PHYN3|nr:hypothetical protein PPTG_10853 [Phytophthora nicotianae INRA-310]ETN10142.1 hypothetical protein PPTG_10853 [Phytophthora nicotianae INRA-310]